MHALTNLIGHFFSQNLALMSFLVCFGLFGTSLAQAQNNSQALSSSELNRINNQPLSPSMSTVTSVGAICWMRRLISFMAALLPAKMSGSERRWQRQRQPRMAARRMRLRPSPPAASRPAPSVGCLHYSRPPRVGSDCAWSVHARIHRRVDGYRAWRA